MLILEIKLAGWQGYSFSAEFKNNKKYQIEAYKNEYMKAFLQDIDLRESCPTCKFAKLPRYVDFTLGDFWGVDKYYPELKNENKGTSLVLVHTNKGKVLINKLREKDIYLKECDLDKSIEGNPSILEHKPASLKRENFFENLDNRKIKELIQLYGKKESLLFKIKRKIIYILKRK